MSREKPDIHTILRYVLVQLPGEIIILITVFLLLHYTMLPAWLIWTGFGVWVLKDTILFFWVWPSYRSPEQEVDPIVGQIGFVVKSCQPEGTVEIYGTLWWAVIDDKKTPLDAGTMIRVRKREGLILFVQSEQSEE